MSFEPDAVETIAFDSYGTIVDVNTVVDPLSEHVDDAALVAKLWRNRSLGYAMVANHVDEHRPFYELIEHALSYALDAYGVDLPEDEQAAIASTYHDLDVYDDVHEGLGRLSEDYDLFVLSNGNEEMLASMVDHADLGDVLAGTISADEVGRFKPAVEAYEHAADEIGRPPGSIAFVAGGWWDVPGALHAGMQGVWIDRMDTIWGPYEKQPDLTIETFHELAAELEG